MIISEKQILQLLDIVVDYINLVIITNDDEHTPSSELALQLLRQIKGQQSDELKEVK